MVRPTNAPVRDSPFVDKLGFPQKPGATTNKASGTSKKKKKTKKIAPGKAVVKKKRMKKVPKSMLPKKTAAPKEIEKPAPIFPDSDEAAIEVVTSAAIKRVATRVGIACISNEASEIHPCRFPRLCQTSHPVPFPVAAIKNYLTDATNICLLHARSSAHYISATRTIHAHNLSSAMETTKLGCLVTG